MQRVSKGFSLVEILVVIAIIAVIAAIAFPVMSRVKEKAKGTTCIANLKQINLALNLYADSNGGYIPPYETTQYVGTVLPTEAKQLAESFQLFGAASEQFFCPSDPYKKGNVPQPNDNPDAIYTSYQTTTWLVDKSSRWPDGRIRVQLSDPPKHIIYIQDRFDQVDAEGRPLSNPRTGHGAWYHVLQWDGAVKGHPIRSH